MGFLKYPLLIGLTLLGMVSCVNSDWYQAQQAANREQERREAIPHVIRQAEGCKVYAFRHNGDIHYFTRCLNSKTVTERNYTVNCGKNCRRQETERIAGE